MSEAKETDRELVVLAAKAAGIMLEWDGHPAEWQPMYYEGKTYHSFDPLTDDGDALRLAVKLGIDICINLEELEVWADDCREPVIGDAEVATRRAIVRAAAEMGRDKP